MDPNEFPLPPMPPAGGPPPVPVVTNAPPIPSNVQAQQPPQPSMLERLRSQVMQDVMPNPNLQWQDRVRAFVGGMGNSQGGPLGNALAAGMAGVEKQRAEEMQARRQTLDKESEAAYRIAQTRLAEAKQLYDQDPTNPQNRERLAHAESLLAQADYYRRGGRGGMGGARGPRPLTASEYAQRVNAINLTALRQFPDPRPGEPEPASVREDRLRRRAAYVETEIARLLESAADIQAGRLPSPRPPEAAQGPAPQRFSVPLTGPIRPAPIER